MADMDMKAKLEKFLEAYQELQAKMGDPDVLANQKEYNRLAKEYADQGPLAKKAVECINAGWPGGHHFRRDRHKTYERFVSSQGWKTETLDVSSLEASGCKDGYFGPKTCRALQAHLGTAVDGYVSGPSDMVRALQRKLNAGTL